MFDRKIYVFIYVFSCVRVKELSCSTSLSFRFNHACKKRKKKNQTVKLRHCEGKKNHFNNRNMGRALTLGERKQPIMMVALVKH